MDLALILQAVSTVAIVGSVLLFTGQVVLSWHRLRGYVADDPHLSGRGTMHAGFQWLAERMFERESTTTPVPASASATGRRHDTADNASYVTSTSNGP